MKKETPYLDFYKDSMAKGYFGNRQGAAWEVGCGGLCNSNIGRKDSPLYFFKPIPEDYESELVDHPSAFWGAGVSGVMYAANPNLFKYGFTTLRQTIVLFCAAINNEL